MPSIAGHVFVVDTNNRRIQKFDSNGVFLSKWGTSGNGAGQFVEPFGVAVDGNGQVYVVDRLRYLLQKFDNNGVYLTQWGGSGSGDGQFRDPQGVAVDGAGNVYVTDVNNRRVQKFDSNGVFLTKWGSACRSEGAFEFDGPWGVAVDGAGHVYLSDPGNHRIQKFGDASPKPTLLTIKLDTQPDSVTNFRFEGNPAVFFLDDPAVDDGDSFTNIKTFTLAAGIYEISQRDYVNWWVSAIDCSPFIKGNPDVALRKLVVTVAAGDHVTCTFVNQRRGTINSRLFHDRNADSRYNSGELWLAGWSVQLYQAPGQLLVSQNTDSNGIVRFNNVNPGTYVVCEVLPAGWQPTAPPANDPVYGQPCFVTTLGAGTAVSLRFGNTTTPATIAAASPIDRGRVTILPDTDDEGNLTGRKLTHGLWKIVTKFIRFFCRPSIARLYYHLTDRVQLIIMPLGVAILGGITLLLFEYRPHWFVNCCRVSNDLTLNAYQGLP